jgi:glycosyltransferase involved in cell wall biosynthesis
MKIGIDFSITPSDGGKYWYSLDFVRALKQLKGVGHQFVTFCANSPDLDATLMAEGNGWKTVFYPSRFKGNPLSVIQRGVQMLYRRARSAFQEYNLRRIELSKHLIEFYKAHDIDIILCPATANPIISTDVPGVFCVHDVEHRIWPEFPEVAGPRIREKREAYYLNGIGRALAIIVPSEIAKEQVTILYNKPAEDIFILPFIVPGHLNPQIDEHTVGETKKRLKLPERYLFYPACYWPHKNHVRIVEAIALLKRERGLKIPVVFVGPDIKEYGVGRKMKKAIKEGDVVDLVHQLGLVAGDDMSALYAGAGALIMPTFLGPTNIPYLEAFQMSCPVITSDLRGIRNQVGKAACLINPRSVESIAEGILRVWQDEAYCQKLIENGHEVLKQWTVEDFTKALGSLLEVCEARLAGSFQHR